MGWNDPVLRQWLESLFYVALAGIGGALGEVSRSVQVDKRPSFWRVLLQASGAAFVGLLVLWMCQATGLPNKWTGVVVGVCGWMGSEATIRLLEKVVFKKLGVSKSEPD